MKIIDSLKDKGFHSSIIASYSCDLPFYDAVVQARLRTAGCLNNILLTDADAYAQAVPSLGNLANHAGRRYTVIPVTARGAFHPKLILQLGKEHARLMLGSANASTGGFGSNKEIVTILDCTDSPSPEQALIAATYDYLVEFIDRNVPILAYKVDRHMADSPWLAKATRATGAVTLSDGSVASLIVAPREIPLQRFAELVGKDSIKRLIALAPFWDKNLKALQSLIAMLSPGRTDILIQPEMVNIRHEAIPPQVCVHDANTEGSRYLHAKVFIAEGEDADHILFGSANCSVAALGLNKVPAINAEACLYLRVLAGTATDRLGLSGSLAPEHSLTQEDIQRLPWTEEPGGGQGQFYPGHIEFFAGRLFWSPSTQNIVDGCRMELLNPNLTPLVSLGIERYGPPVLFERMQKQTANMRFAHIVLKNGAVSAPVIIHHREELRKAAPGPKGTEMVNLLEKIRIGSSDFLDLLQPFERLFFNNTSTGTIDPAPGGAPHHNRAVPVNPEEDIQAQPLTYEQFLEGRSSTSPESKLCVTASGPEVGILVDFLLHYFKAQAEAKIPTVVDGEDEEDLETMLAVGSDQQKKKLPPQMTEQALSRLRKRILKLVSKYLAWTDSLQKDRQRIFWADDAAGLWGLLALLSYLAGNEIQVGEEAMARVIPLVSREKETSFSQLVVLVLGNIFTNGMSPLINRLQVPAYADELAAEHLGTWCASFWAVCVAFDQAIRCGDKELQEDLECIGHAVYTRTGMADGKLPKEEVLSRLRCIHSLTDFGDRITSVRLLRWHEWFVSIAGSIKDPKGIEMKMASGSRGIEPGDYVLVKGVGPRYVRKLAGATIHLNKPGAHDKNEKENTLRINAGYLKKASAPGKPGDLLYGITPGSVVSSRFQVI